MRGLAASILALGLAAAPALARDIGVTLDWPELGPVPDRAEAIFEFQSADGEPLRRQRVPLEAGDAGLQTILSDVPGPAAAMRAGIVHRAQVVASTPRVTMPETRSLTLDPLTADPFLAMGFAQQLSCAQADAAFSIADDGALWLRQDRDVIVLPPIADAPPGWFGADNSEAWLHGNRLQITLDGADLGECVPVLGPALFPLDAAGRAGEWVLRITRDEISLRRDGDADTLTRARPGIAARDGRLHLDAGAFEVTLSDGICNDRASGMPFPVQVSILREDEVMHGCGGDPVSLLRGAEWQVTSLFGVAVDATLDEFPELTMRFVNGRVTGRAACNLYFGDVTADRAGLRFGQMASTRVACPAALLTLERRFLDALDHVTRFDLGRAGLVIFYAGQSPVVTARR